MVIEEYGDIKIFLLCALLGTLSVLGIAAALDRIAWLGRPLRYLGRSTMCVFALHMSLIADIGKLAGVLAEPQSTGVFALAIQAVVNTGLCLALGTLLERWLPFTLGKTGGLGPGGPAQNGQNGPGTSSLA